MAPLTPILQNKQALYTPFWKAFQRRARVSVQKLVVYLHSLAGGGAERHAVRLMSAWIAARPNVELHLVLNKARFAYKVPEAVTVHVIGRERATIPGKLVDQPARLWRLIKLLNRVKPDAVLSLMTGANAFAIVGRALSLSSSLVVVSEHTAYSRQRGSLVKTKLIQWVIRHIYRFSDAVVAVSQTMAHELVELGGVPTQLVHVIPNALDVPELVAQAGVCAIPHPWLTPKREIPVVVFAGRLEHVKGADTLLRVWPDVAKTTPARLLILGTGNEEALLREMVARSNLEDTVQFLGFQSNPFPFISAADAYVMPSRNEGFPVALLEAMTLGRACAAFDCPTGPRELLGASEHGILVANQDEDALADALIELLTNTPLRTELGRKAQKASFRYDLGETAEKYLSLLSKDPADSAAT